MRILFITANRLGDAVLSTGLLDHLLRTHPDARFTIACGPVAEGVFDRMPRRDRTLVLEKQRFDRHWLGLWRQTVGTVWDLVVDLRGSALGFLVPARRRTVLRGGRRAGHKIEQLAASMGVSPPPLPTSWMAPEDVAHARALLPHGPFVGLGPTANWSGKLWPPERFAALFQAVQARMPSARPVIFAGPGAAEQAMAAPVHALLPGAIDLGGRLTLPQASACLARCALFIGNDSGLMHLAAAAGTPTLGLFGPTPAREYAPAGRHAAVAQAAGPPGETSMENLSVPAAAAAAAALLAEAYEPAELHAATPALLALNNDNAKMLSWLDPARFELLVARAFYAARIGSADALLLAFDQDAEYDSPNFLWFRQRIPRFVYIDRVVVADAARGRGAAGRLYDELTRRARAAGHDRLACEVNLVPPNPASDAFHAALGFTEAGRATLQDGRTVRYLTRTLA